jgi:membrane protease YdiL (CAAX protease family)
MKKFLIVIPILVTITGLLASWLIAYNLQTGNIVGLFISSNRLLNFTWNMQLMILPVSVAALGMAFAFNRGNAKSFFRFGLGYSQESRPENEWRTLGPLIAVAFTFGTVMYMSFSVTSQGGTINSTFFTLLPVVLLFSFTNAWTEEIVSRFVIVTGLYGKLNSTAICLISGSIFGLAHIWGTPSGPFGVVASGVMGGLLAKSVIETRSMGWALLIHFLQDVVIFGAGAMVLAGDHA